LTVSVTQLRFTPILGSGSGSAKIDKFWFRFNKKNDKFMFRFSKKN
jgi:hypothetical protein